FLFPLGTKTHLHDLPGNRQLRQENKPEGEFFPPSALDRKDFLLGKWRLRMAQNEPPVKWFWQQIGWWLWLPCLVVLSPVYHVGPQLLDALAKGRIGPAPGCCSFADATAFPQRPGQGLRHRPVSGGHCEP